MKWEKVKNHVACEIYGMIVEGRSFEIMATMLQDMVASGNWMLSRPTHDNEGCFKLYAEKARETVMQWDIRAVGRLRDLFNGAFPPSLRKGQLVADYDADGEWAVIVNKGLQHG